jgi:hypothetical protein
MDRHESIAARKTLGVIETHLLDSLKDDLAQHVPRVWPYIPTADRWLLVSQLQKAIRRGRTDFACSAMQRLLVVDPAYFWRRLRVIAAEDIGLANPSLVAQVIAIAGKRALQRRWNEVHVASYLVTQLCASMKNRTLCDFTCLVDFSATTRRIREELLGQSADAWVDTALDRSLSWRQRAAAVNLLGGAKEITFGQYRAISRFHGDELQLIATATGLSDVERYILSRSRDTEDLAAMLPLAHEILQRANGNDRVREALHPLAECPIDGVMAAAYCRHTRLGQQAFAYLIGRDRRFATTLREAGTTAPKKTLGLLVFQCESGLLDDALDPLAARQLRAMVEYEELASTGITDATWHDTLRSELKQRWAALNEARRTVAIDARGQRRCVICLS